MTNRFDGLPEFKGILDGQSTLRRGDRGEAVSVLQMALHDMGFPMLVLRDDVGVLGVDGAFGGQTVTALENFQIHAAHRFADVRVSGELDAPTMRALIALAPAVGRKAWHQGEPQHAPVPTWASVPSQRLRVVVVQDQHRTFLFDRDAKCIGIFPNAHGTIGNETDAGLKKVRTKLGERDAKAVGRDRWKTEKAFGKRILDLCWASGESSGEELHGTYDYPNMGRNISHGCVRHYNEDIVTIFDAVSVGDYVAIVKSIDDPKLSA